MDADFALARSKLTNSRNLEHIVASQETLVSSLPGARNNASGQPISFSAKWVARMKRAMTDWNNSSTRRERGYSRSGTGTL
jgi:hypothetical protein